MLSFLFLLIFKNVEGNVIVIIYSCIKKIGKQRSTFVFRLRKSNLLPFIVTFLFYN